MVFVEADAVFLYGTDRAKYNTLNTYCQNNTSASDYGNCYNIVFGNPIFVQSDTTTYPTLPCQQNNTCIRFTSTANIRIINTIYNYSGKQAILRYFFSRSHASDTFQGNIQYLYLLPIPTTHHPGYSNILPAPNYEYSSWPIYDPVSNFKAYFNPYKITSGYVNIIRWSGTYFSPYMYLSVGEYNNNNIWYAFDTYVVWAYESSPLAIIPLDYNNDYAPYRELRNVFGYAANGVDQPGWNAHDIIATLKDIFPNRAWAVFDDVNKILYLYNLTMDYVPDWLINKLAPVGIKILQPPPDSSIAQAWLNEINARNKQTSGP